MLEFVVDYNGHYIEKEKNSLSTNIGKDVRGGKHNHGLFVEGFQHEAS